MNILLYDMGTYTQKDLIYYLESMGHNCQNILYHMHNWYEDDFFEKHFSKILSEEAFDLVMSINFCPLVSKICYKAGKKYIAWVYDTPINTDRIEYYTFQTSYVFIFDRIEASRIASLGGINIYHLPLAVNPHRINQLAVSSADVEKYSCDVSFVGNLYQNKFSDIMSLISPYDRGYLQALKDIQLQLYGYSILEKTIDSALIGRLNAQLYGENLSSDKLTDAKLRFCVGNEVTRTERLLLLGVLGRKYNTHYYSGEENPILSHLKFGGTAKYLTEMPKIFKLSRINLNPTLKNIQSGIPLRALDIMSCGGALLSNYQPELAEYFEDGRDIIIYESVEDAVAKAEFYLANEELRLSIAQNGYQTTIREFSYPDRIRHMFKIANVE